MITKDTPDYIRKLIPDLTEKEKQEILNYYAVYGKYEKEISDFALEELKNHPVFGKLISQMTPEARESQNKISSELQRDALVNNNWVPYIEYQMMQGSAYAKMGLEFKAWYEVVILAKKYVTPYLSQEYKNTAQLVAAISGMNRFMDIAMCIIAEAYLQEKQQIIEQDKAELKRIILEISDYKHALDESSIVAVTNQKGIITHVNENFCKISKYTADELIGQDHRIVNSGHHPKEFFKDLWKVIANGKVWKGELKNKAKDGTVYWVDTTIVPFLNEEKKPYQYVAIRSDITERKRGEMQIIALNKELEQKVEERTADLQKSLNEIINFRHLFETTPGMFLVLNPDLTINAVTDEYLAATLVKREDILGKYLFDVFPDNPDDPTANGVSNLHKSLNTVLSTKKSHSMAIQKYDIQRPDGTFEERYWSPINKPVLDANNEIVYLTHGVQDVTTQLRHQRELMRISDENHDLYNNAPCGYLSVDADIFISNINQTLLSWLGYTKEEVVGKLKFEDLLSPESRENHLKTFDSVYTRYLDAGFINDLEFEFQRKNRTIFPTLVNSVAIFDENKNFVKSRTAVFDNTYRKGTEHRLKEVNAELEAQAHKLQASEEELRAQQEELMQANLELEEKTLLLEEKNQIVLEKNDHLIAAARELHQKADELALNSKYKSEFLANMSHELRTPLNSILLLSKLLTDNHDKNLTQEQIEFASVINNSGIGLLELINEILDLSKIESGHMTADIENVYIDHLCKTVIDLFLPVATEKGIEFSVSCHNNIPSCIKSDRIRIEQVLKNFLSNAIKFTEKGKVWMDVRTPNHSEIQQLGVLPHQYITFEVTDTGIGIPKEKHKLIFEAFQQADGSTRRKYGGTGLGLSISKKISQMLGGDILLSSEPNSGSSFSLIIPIDSSTIEPNGLTASLTDQTKSLATVFEPEIFAIVPDEIPDDRQSISKNDKIVLLVEEDPGSAIELVNLIHSCGYKVLVSMSSLNAISLAIKYKPAAIIIDIHFPAQSGFSLLTDIKQTKGVCHIPTLLTSPHPVNLKQAIEYGAVNFIQKPLIPKKIAEQLSGMEKMMQDFPKNILLVDDNEIHLKAIKEFITSPKIKCFSVKDTTSALTLLQKSKFDCLVLDIDLPDENLHHLRENLKTDKRLEKLPVIIYTGKSLSHHDEKRIKLHTSEIAVRTAATFKELSKEISFFLHLPEVDEEEKKHLKPYLKEKALEGKHILIVDDDVRNIFSLTKLLESKKMTVTSSIDGNEALQILADDSSIDLVLMDMMMPNKDGYETIADIRKNQKLKQIKIIAVTAKAMLGDREKCIKAGANDYVTKPVDADQLTSLLKVWLYK